MNEFSVFYGTSKDEDIRGQENRHADACSISSNSLWRDVAWEIYFQSSSFLPKQLYDPIASFIGSVTGRNSVLDATMYALHRQGIPDGTYT